jgi:hypothetical protein
MVTNQTQQFNQMTGTGNRRSKVIRTQRNLKHATIVNKLIAIGWWRNSKRGRAVNTAAYNVLEEGGVLTTHPSTLAPHCPPSLQ